MMHYRLTRRGLLGAAHETGLRIGHQKGGISLLAARGIEPLESSLFSSGPPLLDALSAGAVDPLTEAVIQRQQSLADRLAAAGRIPGPVRIRDAVFKDWLPS